MFALCDFVASQCSGKWSLCHLILSVPVWQVSVLILMITSILPAAGGGLEGDWRGTGQSISGLTVGLQGALHLHQSTQQIGPLQSTRLGSPHVSPLHVNSKGVRLSSTGSPCYVALRNTGSLFRVKMLDHSLRVWSCLCKQVIFKNIRLDLETIRTSAS